MGFAVWVRGRLSSCFISLPVSPELFALFCFAAAVLPAAALCSPLSGIR
jgi:hypothetical protein